MVRQAASPVCAASTALMVGMNGASRQATAASLSAVPAWPCIMARTSCGTRFTMPQIVPTPPSSRARAISVSAPTSVPISGASRRKARKLSKSPVLSWTPATMAP